MASLHLYSALLFLLFVYVGNSGFSDLKLIWQALYDNGEKCSNNTLKLTSSEILLTGGSELFRNLINSSSLFAFCARTGLRPARLGDVLREPSLLPFVGGGVNLGDVFVTFLVRNRINNCKELVTQLSASPPDISLPYAYPLLDCCPSQVTSVSNASFEFNSFLSLCRATAAFWSIWFRKSSAFPAKPFNHDILSGLFYICNTSLYAVEHAVITWHCRRFNKIYIL